MMALYAFASLYALWVLFLAVMNLKQAKDAGRLHKTARAFGVPILIAGYLLDCFVQMTVAVVIFAEWPRELTVSGRVNRLIESGGGWRKREAQWFRDVLLAPFDRSGGHG